MRTLLITAGLLFFALSAYSQEIGVDSVLKLPELEVSASRLDKFSTGQKLRKFDTITLIQSKTMNLGEMLSKSTSIHINSYTYNGLNSVAFRGTSVTHTGLFWNGFRLNPPNNGQMDLSLIPGGYFNNVAIHYGGGSSLFGSGNIGGSIHLNNQPEFKKHISGGLGLAIGSFGEYGAQGDFSFSNGKLYLKTRFLGKKAQNDFSYTDLNGEIKNLKNSALSQAGIIQDINYRFGNKWQLDGSFWFQHNEKEIPATLTSKPSDAFQKDNSSRSYISATKFIPGGSLLLKTAYLYDNLYFNDPDTIPDLVIESEIITGKSLSEFQFEKKLSENILLNSGLVYSWEKGQSKYYENNVSQNQLALYVLYSQFIPSIRWKFNINMRQDFIEYYKAPFTPAMGLEGKINKYLSAKLSVSRNFRVPTFNDRYWVPGGNKDLNPEKSWNEEASLILDMEMEKMRNSTRMIFTFYNSNVDDWILWVPSGIIWSAENVQKVWSRGFEIEYKSKFELGKVYIQFIGGYTYSKSTNEAESFDNDNSYKKQLIYIPLYRYFFTGTISYSGFLLSYNQSYTGKRYVTRDNSESIKAFSLGNVTLSKKLTTGVNSVFLNFDMFNVWDVEYQSVQYNPMPGRYFKFSINYTFNNQKNEEN